MTIRSKLNTTFLGIALLLALVGAVALYYYGQAAETAAITEARNIALTSAHHIFYQADERPDVLQRKQADVQRFVMDLHNDLNRDIKVLDEHGRIVVDVIAGDIGKKVSNKEVAETLKDGIPRTFVETDALHPEGIKQVIVPVSTDEHRIIGAFILEYTPLYNELVSHVNKGAAVIAAVSIVCLLLAIGMGGIISSGIARRIVILKEASRKIARGEHNVAVNLRSGDEIGELADAFDNMAEQIRTSQADLSRTAAELQNAQRVAHVGNWLLEAGTGKVTWSEELHHIFAHDPKLPAPVYQELAKVLTQASFARMNTAMEKTLKTGAPYDVDLELIRPDGTRRWINARGEAVCDASGLCVGVRGTAHDITERKLAEEEIREKEEKLSSLTHIAQDAIIVIDHDGKISFWNPAAEKIFGYSSSEALGEELHAFLAPQRYYETYRKGFERFKETGQGMAVGKTLELEAIRKGGEEFPVELSLSAIQIRDRWQAVGIIRDITERKKTEADLVEKERFLSNIIDSIQDGISICDENLQVIKTNQTIKTWFHNRLPLEGMKCYESFHGRKSPCEFCPSLRTLKSGKPDSRIFPRTDGETVTWLEQSTFPLFDPTRSRVTGVIEQVRDITERKNVETALLRSEALYRSLVNTTDTGYVIVDPEGRVIDANTEYVRLSGHSDLQEILGRSVLEWTSEYEKEKNEKAVSRCAREGYIRNFEVDYVDSHGKVTPIEINATVFEKNGMPQILTLCRDITERRAAERTIEKERDFSRGLIDCLPGVFYVISENVKFARWNRNFEEVTGYSSEEFSRLSPVDLFAGDDRETISKKIRQVFAGGKADAEACIVTKDGKSIPHYFTGVRINMDDETYLVGVGMDIFDRKHAEEALRESEERYRSVVDNVSIGIALISPDMEILSLNRQMREWNPAIDISQRPICYRSFNRPPREEICAYCPTVRTLKEGRVYESVTETPVEGGIVNYRVTASPLKDGAGNVIAAIELVEDITARKRADDEIKSLNEKLELKVAERTKQLLDAQEELVRTEKLSILGQLAGSVGHELRNPLGVINNAIYFLKTVLSASDDTVKEYLNIIKSEVENSERIISDLLDFSRSKTPQTSLITAQELIELSLGKCTIPDIVTLKKHIQDPLPIIKTDPFQMVQVFQNLITNAVQAMPKGGTLCIVARSAGAGLVPALSEAGQPNGLPTQDSIEISVSDTGSGISPEDMKKLFQPLFTTKAKGIGLGLTVCKRLTEANGGTIAVGSEPGKGTTFRVTLPEMRD